jgi:cytochrome c-type biogenesis protein CcmH
MRLEVRVRVAADMADKVKPGAAVFLIARDPERPGPPVAVVRGQAASLPSTMVLTDADVMVPGQSLANLPRLGITARIANGGEASATSGDLFGEVAWTRGAQMPLQITVDRIVP